MRSTYRLVLAAALAALLAAVLMPDQAIAQATPAPTQDIANARDNPLLRRYDGSFIVDYAQRAFEEFELPTAEYAAHGGAFPLAVRAVGRVGVVAVSGLPQVEDHQLVVRVLRSHLAR